MPINNAICDQCRKYMKDNGLEQFDDEKYLGFYLGDESCCIKRKLKEAFIVQFNADWERWKHNINYEFTSELKKFWEDWGFSYEECKEWINSGLQVNDYKFAAWLRDIKKWSSEDCLNNYPKNDNELREECGKYLSKLEEKNIPQKRYEQLGEDISGGKRELTKQFLYNWLRGGFSEVKTFNDMWWLISSYGISDNLENEEEDFEKLKEVYEEYLKWKKIHPDFDLNKLVEWKKKGFSCEQAKEWINVSLLPWDASYACWLIDNKKLDPRKILDRPVDHKELRKEFIDWTDAKKINWKKNYSGSGLESYIDKIILNEVSEIKKDYNLCIECNQPNTGVNWCQSCNAQIFKTTTIEREEISDFIKEYQSKATNEREILEWVPYEQFREINYLAKGGFSTIYKAQWTQGKIKGRNFIDNEWEREGAKNVALKILNDSQNMTVDFLQEISHVKMLDNISNSRIVKCYGVSQDPKTKDYIIIMKYIEGSNMRQYLKDNYSKLCFNDKLNYLEIIASGLSSIHRQKLIHKDLHAGNILFRFRENSKYGVIGCYITDLGLCCSVGEKDEGKLFGVLPYVAPEVLQGEPYTQASDIYSFGMVAYEMILGLPPYHGVFYDHTLATKICEGLRPEFYIKIPHLLKSLIERCWNINRLTRPTSKELRDNLWNWKQEVENKKNSEFYQQYLEVEEFNKSLSLKNNSANYYISPQVTYHSRLLDFPSLPQPQNNPSQEWQTTTLLELKIKSIQEQINLFKEPLEGELRELVDNFIEVKKQSLNNEELKSNLWDLEDKLEQKGLPKEKIDEVSRYCEDLVELEQNLEKQEQFQTNIEIITNK